MMDYSMHTLAQTEYRRLRNENHFFQQQVYAPNPVQRLVSRLGDSLGQAGARLRARVEPTQVASNMATTER